MQESISLKPTSSNQGDIHLREPCKTIITEISKQFSNFDETKNCRACQENVGKGILYYCQCHQDCSSAYSK